MTELATTEHTGRLANKPDHKTNIDNNKTSLSHFAVTSRPSPPRQTSRSRSTAAPLNSKTPAVAPCPSSERQAAPLEQGEKLAKTMRSKATRREQGSKAKLCCFCLVRRHSHRHRSMQALQVCPQPRRAHDPHT